nr:serine/threonine-protein kinase [Sphingomonas horti]
MLNHIFEVKRFLARGGMGEVFEGINVNTDERVAIKVILPALAADPNVTAMFRKEAQTLTRMSHPALVQYRVLAQEPRLGTFYIVTEFIDGANLSDVLDKLSPTTEQLIGLTRRLAEGLAAAHGLGAIHRDISPDNVLLQDGKLERARIIDFGIAKNVEPGSHTIIGDGFAGKLNYVAPEQLGDFNRQVGPWTDVYSLALVILAVAQGRSVDIGGSFVDAINKRRAGIDTGGAPAELRPLLDHMLVADPEQRLRSMDAVIGELAKIRIGHAPLPGRAGTTAATATSGGGKLPKPVLIGGVAASLLAVVGAAGWIAFGGGPERSPQPAAPAANKTAGPVTSESVRRAVQSELPNVACTWLTLTGATQTPSGAQLAFTGVAGRPADAEASVFKSAKAAGASVAAIDFSGVAPISPSFCTVLDSIRPIRATGPARLVLPQPKFEIERFTGGEYAGQLGAKVIVQLSLEGLKDDFALYSVEDTGEISQLIASRAQLEQAAAARKIERLPGQEQYRIAADGPRGPGWSSFLLITGRGVEQGLLENSNTPNWAEHFNQAAKANGWKAEMVWFKFVDELPN